ncbi:hypothetical protein [Kribbella shirazensis]|uniref:Uncharacterized protein n=1 Tax=Kribbella shirazensis TaxID=1105143 RepID=A0A7X5VFE9_9ACTN|nr:hypothetical protein [Kribbella shirazensis]NIK60193.1 hypothetical protein [Kribbella shirazensis]
MRRVDHPRFIAALRQVEDSIDAAWDSFCAESGVPPGTAETRELAEVVLQDTSEFDWRIVDGALNQLTCPDCGSPLGAGASGCPGCDKANGFRFAARETDRPGVPPGNEHAIRVSSAVARTRHRYTPRARTGYELLLPDLLDGTLPTTPEAQRLKRLINQLADDDLERLLTPADLHRKEV